MFRLLWILLICLFSVMLCVYVGGGWVVWFGLTLFSLLVIWCWFMVAYCSLRWFVDLLFCCMLIVLFCCVAYLCV